MICTLLLLWMSNHDPFFFLAQKSQITICPFHQCHRCVHLCLTVPLPVLLWDYHHPSLNWILLSPPSLSATKCGVVHALSQQRISIAQHRTTAVSKAAAGMHRTAATLYHAGSDHAYLLSHLFRWFTTGPFTACAAARCLVSIKITHALLHIRECDGGSTSPCASWLNRCSSPGIWAASQSHGTPILLFPARSLTSVTESTTHTHTYIHTLHS